jgi:hypothetical protein
MNARWLLPGLSAVGLLVACNSAQNDWTKASTANTVAAYETYLRQHPDGEHRGEADERITKLNDNDAWTQATEAKTDANTACAKLRHAHSQCEVVANPASAG